MRAGTDVILKFVEHFAAIKQALDDRGLWDETDGLYYDRLITSSGETVSAEGPVYRRRCCPRWR